MVRGYEGGWFTLNPGDEEDASISDNTTSRWLNYYIRGQQWLFKEVGLRGLYYDGFGAERSVQQRIRRMAVEQDTEAWYDVHGRAFDNAELLPFVDSMWTAEGIDFTRGPDYWLISIAALPFGTFGEMLGGDVVPPVPGQFCGESCANKWRGMLFGMTNRAGWNGDDPNDNKNLWKLWDTFGIEHATLHGWWNTTSQTSTSTSTSTSSFIPSASPSKAVVSSNHTAVLATAYVQKGAATLIAVATWANKSAGSNGSVFVELTIDWDVLGLKKDAVQVVAPFIKSYNRADKELVFPVVDTGTGTASAGVSSGSSGIKLEVPAYQGWLLLVKPK